MLEISAFVAGSWRQHGYLPQADQQVPSKSVIVQEIEEIDSIVIRDEIGGLRNFQTQGLLGLISVGGRLEPNLLDLGVQQ